jgi:hypothetical protein
VLVFGKEKSGGDEKFGFFKKQSAEVQADLELLQESLTE